MCNSIHYTHWNLITHFSTLFESEVKCSAVQPTRACLSRPVLRSTQATKQKLNESFNFATKVHVATSGIKGFSLPSSLFFSGKLQNYSKS